MKTFLITAAGLVLTVLLNIPAPAQNTLGDRTGSKKSSSNSTGSLTNDATVVQGNPAEGLQTQTWRSFCNFGVAGLGLVGISLGGTLLYKGLKRRNERKAGAKKLLL